MKKMDSLSDVVVRLANNERAVQTGLTRQPEQVVTSTAVLDGSIVSGYGGM